MGDNLLAISNVALWIMVVFLLIVVLLIYKQVGEIIIASDPGPDRDQQGPPIGQPAPTVAAFDLATGEPIEEHPKNQLLVFAFPGCPGCEEIAGGLPEIARAQADIGITMLTLYGERDLEHSEDGAATIMSELILPEELHAPASRDGITVLASASSDESSPHRTYGITATPFALLIDAEGMIVGKGMVRSRDHIVQMIGFSEGISQPVAQEAN